MLLLFLTLPALANVTTSSLTGRVIIADGTGFGVTVTASSPALQQPRTTVTNARGRYWLGALPPGTYDVTFSLEGHTTLTKRAILELGRVARADATLEANPDEDTVTSTAVQNAAADTIAITSHFDDRTLDRMPTGRIGTASLGPGTHFGYLPIVDGVLTSGFVTSEETIDQITVIRGAPPVEWDTFVGTAIAARTRSGGEEFFFTLRDTITSDDDDLLHFGEAMVGGRVLPQRLWFFAAGWTGEQDYSFRQELRGTMLKLDAQIGDSHRFDGSYNNTEQGTGFTPFESDTASLRYTGAIGPRFTSEVATSRTTIGTGSLYEASVEFFSGRASYMLGDHLLTGGLSAYEGDGPHSRSLFASDRWSFPRWNVYAGLRYDEGHFAERLSPRVAVTYDLRGDGRRAISASWGEYAYAAQPQSALRTSTLGYATAIGNAGSARIDVLRRESGEYWMNELQLDARYRLFDRFEAGATYTLVSQYESGLVQPAYPEHAANVWFGAGLPVGSHEFGVTLLQRYIDVVNESLYPTDLALRYSIPFSRLGLMIAAEATNVFASDQRFQPPRSVRFWMRVRM